MKILYLALTLSFILSFCHSKKQEGEKENQVTETEQTTFADNPVVAHRGAWKKNNFPENSIAALKEAIRLNCTGSEFDIHMTTDDSLVINHDGEYNGFKIEETPFDTLRAYPLANGELIPTLEEYLKAGMNQHTTRLVLEIKPSEISTERGVKAAEKVVALVKKLKVEPLAMYISFDYDIVKKNTGVGT